MRPLAAFVLILIVANGFAQTDPARPQFDVASVKLSMSDESHVDMSGEQFTVRHLTMTELLRFAYGLQEDSIIGSPPWFRSDRFDIVAKKPAGASAATAALMLQSLLAAEFRLAAHEEQRPPDAYALVAAKGGPKLAKASNAGPPTCTPSADGYQYHLKCTAVTMSDFVDFLRHRVPSALIDRPVVDATGITGAFDLTLDWVLRFDANTGRPTDDEGGTSLFVALTRQLGLRLDERKVPQPVIVIDRAERLAAN